MPDILSVGARSLLAIQQALNTTGHNIANANTDGYSRQTISMSAAPAEKLGFGYLGKGVNVDSVQRSYDSFLTGQVRNFTSSQSRNQVFSELSARIDDLVADSSNSMSTSIQRFFSSVQDVANSPSTLPERQAMIGEATSLVERYKSFNGLLVGINNEVNNDLNSVVTEINGLADSIAVLNREIVSATLSANGNSPNDLLDQRDRLLAELSTKVSVSTVEDQDSGINVFIGQGQALVVGSQATHLQTQYAPYDSSKLEIGLAGQTSNVSLDKFLSGGELEGLLDFRKRVLDKVQSEVGLVMLGLAETVNREHSLGMDLENQPGNDIFSVGGIPARANVSNTGTAAPAVTLNDVGQLTASDYSLHFDGGQWHLSRLSDNTTVSGMGPLSIDGMTVDLSTGTPATGDSFLLQPARDAANAVKMAISDPRKIAAAGRLTSNIPMTNTGSVDLSKITVDYSNSLPMAGPVTLTFNPDALGPGVPGFDVSGGPGGTIAYDPASESAGKEFTFAAEGFSFTISGIPDAGDSLVIDNNANASGDNRAMLGIAALQHKAMLNGGSSTYQALYGATVAGVGVVKQQADSNVEMNASLLAQAELYKESASGVNLDEEAANMLRFQQQYQAAAQLIKVADDMFQSLLGSIN